MQLFDQAGMELLRCTHSHSWSW